MNVSAALARARAVPARRWLIAAVAVVALIALGIVAGRWQYGRYEERSAALAAQEAAATLPPTTLEDALASDRSAVWREVTVTGTIAADSITELRGRSVENTASLQYLAWLDTGDGAVLINLGWAPRTADTVIDVPQGAVVVAGTARDMEPDDGRRDDGATRIVPDQMPTAPGEVAPVWVSATSVCAVDGAACLDALAPVPSPSLRLGPHLSYAWQWWLLALVALPLVTWLMVRDAEHADAGTAARRPRRREPTDEEIEDAL